MAVTGDASGFHGAGGPDGELSSSEDLRLRLEAQVAAKRDERALARSHIGTRRTSPPKPARGGFGRQLVRLLIVLVAAVGFAFSLRAWVVQPFWIPSQSMEPTLHGCPGCDPDRLLVDKLSYHLHAIHRGDVVVFERPPGVDVPDANLVKRVIGLPGEVVRAANGTIYIGNRVLTEPYVAAECDGTRDFAPVRVPVGQVFVMGDNRCDSRDSRSFGPISTSLIIGRAFVIVWPLGRIHWL